MKVLGTKGDLSSSTFTPPPCCCMILLMSIWAVAAVRAADVRRNTGRRMV